MGNKEPYISVKDLTMAYGDFVVMRDLNFTINHGDIFIIMGGSGCGKSTLLKHMIGLKSPAKGEVLYRDFNFWKAAPSERQQMMRNVGVLYQSGALWSSMTLAENVALPLQQYTKLSKDKIREQISLKLALVGLSGFEDFYPSEISGGMCKRAGLARAMALDPEILFFDEPSAGLDPVSAKRLDDLILQLRDSLDATVVVVTHELASIFAIGNNSVFLDPESRTMIASGDPNRLLVEDHDPRIQTFLRRGETEKLGGRKQMAKQASKTVIGVFVISSIAMLVAGVIIFGSGDLFKKTNKYVMFFESSVKGLSVGAPVIWHGVEVGSVSSIVLRANPEKESIDIPVVIEVDPNRMEFEGEGSKSPHEILKGLIAKGLRARLGMESMVTGSAMIEVEFLPGTPVRLTGLDNRYPEIPTVKSGMDKLIQSLQSIPIDKIAGKLVKILDHLDGVLGDPEIKEMVHNLNVASKELDQVLEDADKLVLNADGHVKELAGNLNNKLDTLSDGMQATLADARNGLKGITSDVDGVSSDARKLLQDVGGQVKPLSGKIQTTLVSARAALEQAKKTLVTVNGFVGEHSDTRNKLNRTLDEIGGAAKSLRSLLDYLERHPESLLQGKGGRGR